MVSKLSLIAKRLCTWKVQPLITTKALSNVDFNSTTHKQNAHAAVATPLEFDKTTIKLAFKKTKIKVPFI